MTVPPSAPQHIAVIDIGKTNAKLALVDLAARTEIAVITRSNTVIPGPPYPHFDTEGHWAFILDGLSRFHAEFGVDAISVTTHGACAALLGADGQLAAPVLDYEHTGPDEVRDAYDRIRPAFAETGAARLPMGLNLGAQLFWQFHRDPALGGRVRHVVTWPQYWGHRLTGGVATDVTSLGCHTDLWNPYAGRFSSLVARLGLAGKIASALKSAEVLGRISAPVAARTGLAPETPVCCGIHDSNASLLPHLIDRKGSFSVVSTGTWVIAMTVGGKSVPLDPARDTLVNVNAFGAPVPSARFMGGREHDLIRHGRPPVATRADAGRVLASGLMLLPSVQPGSGPFPQRPMTWLPESGPWDDATREVALGYYLGLMTAECLSMTGGSGPVIIEGPFARNPFFREMLAAATAQPVLASASQTGTAIGAALLFATEGAHPAQGELTPEPFNRNLLPYVRRWREHVSPTPN